MDDSKTSLGQIATHHQEDIISLLLKTQRHKMKQNEFLSDFLSRLECFHTRDLDNLTPPTLPRSEINAFTNGNYVALSYTWDPSEDEDETSGEYFVQDRTREWCDSSPVRNCVFRRITNYMNHLPHRGRTLLWIDRHSLPQKVCKEPTCGCQRCLKKRAGLQFMGWVYKCSNYPTALLGRRLKSTKELHLLHDILTGGFIYGNGDTRRFLLKQSHGRGPREALQLLYAITSDLWWQRAWTFQENYKAGENMTLLIPHPGRLEVLKRRFRIFNIVPGELCIQSVDLFLQATRFCGAFLNTIKHLTQRERNMIGYIISRLGRYTNLLRKSESMTPAIIADVEARGIKDPWDRIPIVANCCDYPVRLDTGKLQEENHSLSLAMLATCLLNGEILHNNDELPNNSASVMLVSKFMKIHLFDKIRPPRGERPLSFNKGCRFNSVELTEDGIRTRGHLWRLGPIIRTTDFNSKLPWVDISDEAELNLIEQRCLARLCQELRFLSQPRLAKLIEEYLHQDLNGNRPYDIGENYMLMMAKEVARATEEGQSLRLGRLWDNRSRPYTAIFVWEDAGPGSSSGDDPAFVFTSLQPKKADCGGHDANDTDRHVSLEVDKRPIWTNNGVIRLYTKKWRLGMCFFTGCRRMDVLFPWPPTLKCIKPVDD